MQLIRISYQANFWKMLISGVLGVWLHVLIDGIYHFDIYVFWPSKTIWWWRTMCRYIGADKVETICLVFLLAAVAPYLLAVWSFPSGSGLRLRQDEKDKIIKDTGGPK